MELFENVTVVVRLFNHIVAENFRHLEHSIPAFVPYSLMYNIFIGVARIFYGGAHFFPGKS